MDKVLLLHINDILSSELGFDRLAWMINPTRIRQQKGVKHLAKLPGDSSSRLKLLTIDLPFFMCLERKSFVVFQLWSLLLYLNQWIQILNLHRKLILLSFLRIPPCYVYSSSSSHSTTSMRNSCPESWHSRTRWSCSLSRELVIRCSVGVYQPHLLGWPVLELLSSGAFACDSYPAWLLAGSLYSWGCVLAVGCLVGDVVGIIEDVVGVDTVVLVGDEVLVLALEFYFWALVQSQRLIS